MIRELGVLIITKNSAETLDSCLMSIKDLTSEIVVVDSVDISSNQF